MINEYDNIIKKNVYYKPTTLSILKKNIQYINTNNVKTDISNKKCDTIIYIKNFIIKIIENKFKSCEVKSLVNNISIYVFKLLDELTINDISEKTIYDKIINSDFYKNIKHFIYKYYIEELNKNNNTDLRGSYRIYNIKKFIVDKSNVIKSKKINRYLDIGCFDGCITKCIGEYFNLENNNIHGIDIKKYKEYEFKFNEFKFNESDEYVLPYDDNSFDLITCFMVLHHIPSDKLQNIIDEIYRVLKTDGVVILREHSPINNLHKICLDIMHDFYDLVWNENHIGWDEKITNYKNSNEWVSEFLNASFIVDVKPYVSKDINKNPFMCYFCSFKKP